MSPELPSLHAWIQVGAGGVPGVAAAQPEGVPRSGGGRGPNRSAPAPLRGELWAAALPNGRLTPG